MTERPYTDVAVIMRCERIDNRWQPWRWSLAEVVMHDPAFGTEPRQLLSDEREQRWMFPGFRVELFRDDAEGYHLNLTSPAPCWFVMWRRDEDTGTGAIPLARPVARCSCRLRMWKPQPTCSPMRRWTRLARFRSSSTAP